MGAMGPGGLEPPHERTPVNTVQGKDLRQGEQDADAAGAAESDAVEVADEDLSRLIDAWPQLPEAIRAGIVAMVNAAADA